jgi:hypothetical protein
MQQQQPKGNPDRPTCSHVLIHDIGAASGEEDLLGFETQLLPGPGCKLSSGLMAPWQHHHIQAPAVQSSWLESARQ